MPAVRGGNERPMVRLRTSSPHGRGWTRRRAGTGWTFLDERGVRLDDAEQVERVRSLAIPPAWREVWICPWPNGHIQAVGTDDAGRRQYLYHPEWRVKRDKQKFDRVLRAAERMPEAREAIRRDLGLEKMPLERANAVAVRLLDLGYFRIGSDVYADTNGSFGLTTLRKHHVRRQGQVLRFRFVGKSGVEHSIDIDDVEVLDALDTMRRRRGGSERLLAYQLRRSWHDLDGPTVNEYLGSLFDDLTAKDFRTWHATVIAAAALAASDEPGDTKRSRQKAVRAAVTEVSDYLGNTPTMAKSSYVDPRVIDLYESGTTIDRGLVTTDFDSPGEKQRALEQAVLELLR